MILEKHLTVFDGVRHTDIDVVSHTLSPGSDFIYKEFIGGGEKDQIIVFQKTLKFEAFLNQT